MSRESVVIKNKKAQFEYELMQIFTAGIMLTGTEVKSVREGKANLTDSFGFFQNGSVWVKNMHIAEFKQGSHNNHEPKRTRKLLLNKAELRKIESRLKEKGTTLIPVQLYFNERSYAKLDLAVARGKKSYDKRESLKKKDLDREMRRTEE